MSLSLKNLQLTKNATKPSTRTIVKATVVVALLAYLIYHLFQGNRGLLALFEIKQIVKNEQKILEDLKKENEKMRKRIKLLHPESLDIDMLEERSRIVLDIAAEDEVIFNSEEVFSYTQNSEN